MTDTTHQSGKSEGSDAGLRTLVLRWVFPGELAHLESELSGNWVVGRGLGELDLTCSEVSRRHARVGLHEKGPFVQDLGSRNGTFVNGTRVGWTHLDAGDVVRVGGCIAVVAPARGMASPAHGFQTSGARVIGTQFKDVLASSQRIARSQLAVVLVGETGTGKEVMARAIHELSGRSGDFVATNCAAMPEGLVEAQLFGHSRGAFTGALRAERGLFRAAHEGTLFLDEVADLPRSAQAKLLRVIECGEVTPLGTSTPVSVRARIVVASQVPLEPLVARGSFRQDLYARLNGATLRLPPLRERRADIAELFAAFVDESAGGQPLTLSPKLVEALLLHDWPMNVRELKQVSQRLVVVHGHEGRLKYSHLPELLRTPTPQAETQAHPDYARLMLALKQEHGNISRASRLLGMSRQRVYRLLRQHQVQDLDAAQGGHN